ncbi:hypothetical protein ACJX0J_011345, partial [Zea mays]
MILFDGYAFAQVYCLWQSKAPGYHPTQVAEVQEGYSVKIESIHKIDMWAICQFWNVISSGGLLIKSNPIIYFGQNLAYRIIITKHVIATTKCSLGIWEYKSLACINCFGTNNLRFVEAIASVDTRRLYNVA